MQGETEKTKKKLIGSVLFIMLYKARFKCRVSVT